MGGATTFSICKTKGELKKYLDAILKILKFENGEKA